MRSSPVLARIRRSRRDVVRHGPVAVALALFVLLGCSRSNPPTAAGNGWRLFDDLSAASIETEIDTPRTLEAYLHESVSLVDTDLMTWLAANGSASRDPQIDSILFENVETSGPPNVSFAVLPSSTQRVHWMLFELSRALAPDEAIFCIELPSAQAIEFATHPAWLVNMLRRYSNLLRIARVDPRFDHERLRAIQFEPTRPAIQLLVGVVQRTEPLGPTRFRAARLERVRGWQLTTDKRRSSDASPVREVELGHVTRRCLALGSRGRIRATMVVDSRQPVFECSVGLLWQGPNAEVRIRGKIESEGASLEVDQTLSVPGAVFVPLQLDLAKLAGRQASLDLEFLANKRREESMLLVSDCTIDGTRPVEGGPPDLIVISLDTTRRDRMSLYGHGRPTTPEIDRFASHATVFDTAITAASWTLPSHTTIFSGEYPDRHGVFGSSSLLLEDTPWLPEILRRRGYSTLAYTGGGYLEPVFGHSRGYDRYGTIDVAFPLREFSEREGDDRSRAMTVVSERERRELLDLLESPRRRPMFLFVHTYAVHNYSATPRALSELEVEASQIPSTMKRIDRKVASRQYQAQSPKEREQLKGRADLVYDATLRDADRLVGEILAALERTRRLERSIVVILSDHGEEIFDRDDIGHGQTVFDEQIRVPLIIKAPGFAPKRIDNLVSLVDLTPTLLELLGLPPLERAADGRSLVPLLRGEELDTAPVISRGDRKGTIHRSLRGSTLKLIENKPVGREGTYEMFDLRADPSERMPLGERQQTDLERLKGLLIESVRGLEKLRGRSGNLDLTGELESELRELGYLGGDR